MIITFAIDIHGTSATENVIYLVLECHIHVVGGQTGTPALGSDIFDSDTGTEVFNVVTLFIPVLYPCL